MMSVYALVDPRTNKIHYIGVSIDVEKRYIQHLHLTGKNKEKTEWIRQKKKEGTVPSLLILEERIPDELAYQREEYWIQHYLAQGMPLTNKIVDLRQKDVLLYCKHCGEVVPQLVGKRKREYCNDVCRQLGYRGRKKQETQATGVVVEQVQDYAVAKEREKQYREDTDQHAFKKWLRQQHRPGDYGFVKRLLDDTRLPHQGSRGTYMGRLRLYKYSAEEIYHFEEIWKDMLFSKS